MANLQVDIRNIFNVSVISVINHGYPELHILVLSFLAALIFLVILMVIFLLATRDTVRTKMNTILASLACSDKLFIAVSTMLRILAAALGRCTCILSPVRYQRLVTKVNSAIPVPEDEIGGEFFAKLFYADETAESPSAENLDEDEILASGITIPLPKRLVRNRGFTSTVNSAAYVQEDKIGGEFLGKLIYADKNAESPSAENPYADEILASVSTVPFNRNYIDWKPTSVMHKQKFERLLKVWEKEPELMTIIDRNGVCFKDEFLIGHGSCGTEVYICLGFDGIERAIKRLPRRLCKNLLKNERDILTSRNAVDSPRIVNYWFYDDTTNKDFCYLILSLYECNLDEYVRKKGGSITPHRAREMIRQALEGLEALHAREPRIVHRDLKPANILVDVNGNLVLSDFGIGRFLPEEGETYRTTTASGSKGWLAYECIDWDSMHSSIRNSSDRKEFRWKEKSDIQAAGMLAFYIRTNGGHPFGPEIVQMINLHKNNPVGLKKLDDEVFKDLLSQMLDQDLDKRPFVEQALKHPYFMSAKEQMKFLEAVGNQREVKKVDTNCDAVKLLDNLDPSQPRCPLLPSDWKVVIHPDDLNTFCEGGRPPSKEDGGRYTHFLRFIRNVFQHWHDKPRPALKDKREATCLEEYFLQYFPTLPLVVHQIVRDRPDWKTRDTLKEFFPVINRRAEAC